jgi:hypothetical protein
MVGVGRGDHAPSARRAIRTSVSPLDNLRIARAVVDKWDATTEGSDDLKARMRETVTFIRQANGLDPLQN